jgi:hypothetical protein
MTKYFPHSTDFLVSVFYFHLILGIHWFPHLLTFLMTQWSSKYIFQSPCVFIFSVVLLLLMSSFIPLWSDDIKEIISISLYSLGLTLCPKISSTVKKVQWIMGNFVYSVTNGWNIVYIIVKSIWSTWPFNYEVPLFIFFVWWPNSVWVRSIKTHITKCWVLSVLFSGSFYQ